MPSRTDCLTAFMWPLWLRSSTANTALHESTVGMKLQTLMTYGHFIAELSTLSERQREWKAQNNPQTFPFEMPFSGYMRSYRKLSSHVSQLIDYECANVPPNPPYLIPILSFYYCNHPTIADDVLPFFLVRTWIGSQMRRSNQALRGRWYRRAKERPNKEIKTIVYRISSKISGLLRSRCFIRSFMAVMMIWVLSSAPCFELFSAAPVIQRIEIRVTEIKNRSTSR